MKRASMLELHGGFHAGPLFVPKIKQPTKPRMQSTFRERLLVARYVERTTGTTAMTYRMHTPQLYYCKPCMQWGDNPWSCEHCGRQR